MSNSPRLDDASTSLEELVEKHLRRLTKKIKSDAAVEEIASEVASFNDLLVSYQLRDELLEQLIDNRTPDYRRRQIVATLKAQHLKVALNQAELVRLHAASHELLQRSTQLIVGAQRVIDQESSQDTRYALEPCGFCSGTGGTSTTPCAACHGKRSVLVRQPPIKCPRCKGDGKPDREFFSLNKCVVCRGYGWVLTVESRD